MDPHATWFDYIPGYYGLREQMQESLGRGWVWQVFQATNFQIAHTACAMLVLVFLAVGAFRYARAVSGSGDTGPALPATAANIARVARGELGLRQRPGPRNSLGLAKFIFPNDQNVYFHGTPATELFSRTRRDFSHGCIRLEDPARFAVWSLRDPDAWSAGQVRRAMDGPSSERVNLTRPLPVVIYYATAIVRPDRGVEFYEDIYGHDARLEGQLARGYPFR